MLSDMSWLTRLGFVAPGRFTRADDATLMARLAAGDADALALPGTAASGASAPLERRRELRVIHASEMPLPPAVPAPPVPPVPPIPPVPLMLQLPMQPRSGGVTTALPPREIDGIKVNGERTTWTIEAGKIGNEKTHRQHPRGLARA